MSDIEEEIKEAYRDVRERGEETFHKTKDRVVAEAEDRVKNKKVRKWMWIALAALAFVIVFTTLNGTGG